MARDSPAVEFLQGTEMVGPQVELAGLCLPVGDSGRGYPEFPGKGTAAEAKFGAQADDGGTGGPEGLARR